MIRKTEVPSLFIIIIGLLIIFIAFQTNPLDSTKTINVESMSGDKVPDTISNTFIMNYSDLSDEGKSAFRKGLGESETRYGIYKDPPKDFRFSDQNMRYYVKFQGEYYALITSGQTNIGSLKLMVWLFYILTGLGIALSGFISYRNNWVRVPLTVLVGLISLFLSFELGLYRISTNVVFELALGTLVTITPALITWFLLGNYEAILDTK